MSDTANAAEGQVESTEDKGGEEQGQAFTQADVDRIVKDRLAQQAKNKFGDYTELKTRAESAQTLEQRLASLETELTTTRTQALKTSVAAKYGISTEPGENGAPSDADLFLTGSDADSLTAQAERLAARVADRKKNGNVAPKEGSTTSMSKARSPWAGVIDQLDSRKS
ncbi:hypothetical protein [Curtobacterium sp. MCLR17_034]|uniref:hypothetical protein n=1 Tax=Curtobacterium sp. MCLR17_034 TaxID=2175623 RepID=UPI000DAA8C19|nr:hypothetical protein [Curtobacterium sp. MCLR17_034]PZF11760.1 hypothetical protein DEI98_06475 [Curtobacterium sp. MCLR17_034]